MRAGYLFAVDKRVLSRYSEPLASYPRNVHNFPEKPAYRGRVRLSISPRITHFLRLPTPRTHDYAGKTVRLTTAPSPIPDEFLPPLLGVKISRRILLANSSGSSESRGSPFAGHPILPRFRTADGPRKFANSIPSFPLRETGITSRDPRGQMERAGIAWFSTTGRGLKPVRGDCHPRRFYPPPGFIAGRGLKQPGTIRPPDTACDRWWDGRGPRPTWLKVDCCVICLGWYQVSSIG